MNRAEKLKALQLFFQGRPTLAKRFKLQTQKQYPVNLDFSKLTDEELMEIIQAEGGTVIDFSKLSDDDLESIIEGSYPFDSAIVQPTDEELNEIKNCSS